MNLKDMAERLGLEPLTAELGDGADVPIERGYVTDLLSDVLGHGPKGGVLVTVQCHMNVVAVAVHAEMAAVIFAQGRTVADPVREKAIEEKVRLYRSTKSAFEVVGTLHDMGVRGPDA